MKLSEAGLGITRLQNVDTVFPAQDILVQSGQLVQYGAGIYGYNSIPLKLRANIEKIIKEELEKIGCVEVQLPLLQPRCIWDESDRWNGYVEEGTLLTVKTEKSEFCLAPTAEEAIVEFSKRKLKSHKNLPTVYYQIGEKFRNEIRSRGFLLRGKSFLMMDAYSFNKDEKDLVKSYELLKIAYKNIFERLGLNVFPVAADNGAIGGKKSEEYMMISQIGEDTVLYDSKTGQGFNIEIKEKDNFEEYLKDYDIEDISSLKEERTVELGHIFQLGTKYSETMNATYVDSNGEEKVFYMGCYGIGVSRTLATVYENNVVKDKNNNPCGFVLPYSLAPYKVQIIYKKEKESKALEIYELLNSNGVACILDDREDTTIGSSIKDVKILGTPYMIVLGDKTNDGELEIENVKTENKEIIQEKEILEYFKNLSK